jgi:hypothetical protein
MSKKSLQQNSSLESGVWSLESGLWTHISTAITRPRVRLPVFPFLLAVYERPLQRYPSIVCGFRSENAAPYHRQAPRSDDCKASIQKAVVALFFIHCESDMFIEMRCVNIMLEVLRGCAV